MRTRNLAIMLTDIKGFTSKTAAFSRAQTQELLTRHRELVLPVIEKFRGRLVKTIGDAFLVVFESPTDAVICGVEVQDVLKAHNAEKPQQERIEIRIAINSGEVAVHDDGDVYGDAVNITSRLESIAEAGEVFFTEAVYLAMNKREVPSSEIGYRQFKGVPEKIKVFRVLREVPVGSQPPGEAPAAVPEASPQPLSPAAQAPRAGFFHRLLSLLVDVVIVMVILSTFHLAGSGPAASFPNRHGKAVPPGIKVQDVHIDRNGIEVSGKNGAHISIDKNGASVVGPDGRVWTSDSDAKFDRGGRKGREVPVKMLVWALYGAILLWRFGATPGMKITKLKLVDYHTGGAVPADKVFLRTLFSLVSLSLLLGYVWALWEKDHRTWHDLIAGTRIVKA